LGEVSVGSYSYIADRSSVGHTSIGRFCSIGPHFLCGYGEHPAHFVTTSPVFYSTSGQCGTSFVENNSFVEKKEVRIGHDVWIGARVFVRDGVKIGNGAILAAGAVVGKDVPEYSIVGGVPAQVLRLRFAEPVIARLLEVKWWEWEEERLREAATLLGQPDVERFLEWASGGVKPPAESHCEARK